MKLLKKLLGIGLISMASSAMAAPTYTYVGSWFVDEGDSWSATNGLGQYITPVLSGVEAAAYIFGGSASDYAISTVSSNVADINFKAWMDGWGDSNTYGWNGTPAAQDLHIDVGGDGLYASPGGAGSAYSAYVNDHGLHLQNFAFRVTNSNDVPEPGSVALLAAALAALAFARRSGKA
ncbi:PEP-CTERM sorting domain-containing protein [Noviherbaspirillum cavernae]|uniref:PEP-CTERM sorting domain-containing protein n=1 Tax=Noviherbaspirillum cavernae TaxID=2320862 RepID=A0A418WXB5_9BURK|nr:PEP-CTERM sorting domain-containing protein [Noviherbaspirillum cavernae]RJG04888.1 PEP-CTERM sorting domain-containing protein [Noviherbaspirillum cavernae]